MRRNALFVMAVLGVCLAFAFGLSAPSAKQARPASPPAPSAGAGQIGGIGPGIRPGGTPVLFRGLTTRKFPMGVGALTLSRACNEELPISRLCEWGDLFRALPPIALDTEVLAAANYDTRPAPMCLNPGGGTRCSASILMRPAACCGYPPPPPTAAFLTLTPSSPQTINACSDTFDFTALAQDANSQPMQGVSVFFYLDPLEGSLQGNFLPASAITDVNGEVKTTLTLASAACESACVGAGADCRTQVQAVSYNLASNVVELLDGIP